MCRRVLINYTMGVVCRGWPCDLLINFMLLGSGGYQKAYYDYLISSISCWDHENRHYSMDRIKDYTPRKLSVELVAVLNRKNGRTKLVVCKPKNISRWRYFIHPSIVLWVVIVEFCLYSDIIQLKASSCFSFPYLTIQALATLTQKWQN